MSASHFGDARSEVGSKMAPEVDPAQLELIAWVRSRIRLKGLRPSMWGEEHDAIVVDFLQHPDHRRLVAFVDPGNAEASESPSLVLMTPGSQMAVAPKQFVYFVRSSATPLTPANIGSTVQFGLVSGAGMDSLLRHMNGVFVPRVVANETWPESVKKDFSAQMHRFMASLVETSHQVKGNTVLYLPRERVALDASAATDKDLVQRLESTVIHWTRQIKEVVNSQDSAQHGETAGPLEEIDFWRSRTIDLSGISEQLNRQGVREIVGVLEVAKSSYLGPFDKLSKMIQKGSQEANDNLRFLNILTEPCEQLAKAEPKEIPALLPNLLNRVRVIGTVSANYTSKDRLTGLLRKVSNEIIRRCCDKISLDDVFDGDVLDVMKSLNESIDCGVQWKEIYKKVAAAIDASPARPKPRSWSEFDDASIFAQVDAFVQRCRDLLEVCEGQIQFARKSLTGVGHEKAPLPAFGGARGPEIAKSLLGIEAAFEDQVARLRELRDDILDVKATRWHDDYNHFKNGIKDLEVMMQNVINGAFEGVSTIVVGVDLLEAFDFLAQRPAVKRCVETNTAKVFRFFSEELERTKAQFEARRESPPLAADEPRYAGAALWAKGMMTKVERDWMLLANAHFLVRSREATQAEVQYKNLMSVLGDFIRKSYRDWMSELSDLDQAALQARLNKPLISRVTDASRREFAEREAEGAVPPGFSYPPNGYLECNFDKGLLRLFTEVYYWGKFQGEVQIPYVAHDVTNQKEKLRVLREYVLLVVKDYNQILMDLSSEERRLFQEVTRRLDRRVSPGQSKMTWASKGGVIEWFVKDVRKHCAEAYALVQEFKANKRVIEENCATMASTLLVNIEKNYVHEEGVFEDKQLKHRAVVRDVLDRCHTTIKDTMKKMYEHFAGDPADVQKEWALFVKKADKRVEESLRTSVKKSLQELSRTINGDAKNDPQQLFKVNVVLENNRVEFKPTMIALTQMVNVVSKELITVISVVPRLSEVLEAEIDGYRASPAAIKAAAAAHTGMPVRAGDADARVPMLPSFYDVVSNDEDILKILVNIMNGMSASATELQKYLSYWDKYKHLWETDKNNFIRRYAKAGRPLMQFQIDIGRYRDQQNDIKQGEELTQTINFIKIDCSLLKSALIDHCIQWQKMLTGLLNDNARSELEELHSLMKDNTVKLRTTPRTLDDLSASLNLLKQLQSEMEDIEARFDPLEQRYKTLADFDVAVPESELLMLQQLRPDWAEFTTMLTEVDSALAKSKTTMKKDLQDAMDNFNVHVQDVRKSSLAALPYGADYTVADAFAIIEDFKDRAANTRAREQGLAPGLAIFDIPPPAPTEVVDLEKDLKNLEAVWGLMKQWDELWEGWKTGLFRDLVIDDMEMTAGQFTKQIGKMREIKKWGVWGALRDKVEQFRATMPLIQDLKNEAMRDRHWEQLLVEINKTFDPYADDFTLEKVFTLGLHTHAEFIGELSANANKELAIEQALEGIKTAWADIDIDMVPFKEVYFKVRSTEDLFTQLEDNQVSLSTMKASRFFKAFEEEINFWESRLGLISEVVEMLLTVQRQWMYLESIFNTSEDIRRQLPRETGLFDQVNKAYMEATELISADPNAVRACSADGMLEALNDMDSKLETIQKSLDQYLETKRKRFPRFYFLSNDDLLEILGQQRDPEQVQKHIKKCFEGIQTLQMIPIGKQGNRTVEAVGMNAPDGEKVQFVGKVIVDGPVEEWLIKVEESMILCLQKVLAQSIHAHKGSKEKWIKDFPGQLLITTGLVSWSISCHKQLLAIAAGTKSALRQQRKKQVAFLNRLTAMVRSKLEKVTRKKLVALITMEIHNRDVMERMIKAGCNSVTDFEWLSQLRLYFDKEQGEYGIVQAVQTQAELSYGYEYQGNNGRLVVTPLTDRCVLTLTTALHLQRGGSPMGPAGTGKTETVKDLGKNLAKFVVVFNCSDGLDYKSVGRMFSGLVQSGGWGCFDEFNRIPIEVLSVVATQIMSIMTAIKARKTEFLFMDSVIRCNWGCGIFITMNPGYAGRTELPDNLKSLFRPVAMMVPDLALIAEVMLQAEGFMQSRLLAKKTVTLYGLMVQQLSKQDHYDYGLRSLRGVLVAAGTMKRADPEMNEEFIMLRAIRDMNVPKFIKPDKVLFKLLLGDLFPSLDLPPFEGGTLGETIAAELHKAGLQRHDVILQKCIELRDSKATRHCNMLVGRTLAGKSTAWKMLAAARTTLAKAGEEGYTLVRHQVINPKSISMNELYGAYDLQTMEWTDGILSSVFRVFARDDKPDEKWLILDGPVDTLWIESMNTVMDDNRTLTLINGDRIGMSSSMSLLFEVQDLAVASPATVSRAGMIYLDVDDLGWEPFVKSFVERQWEDAEEQAFFSGLFEKYVPRLLEALRREASQLVPISAFTAVRSLTNLITTVMTPENGCDKSADPEGYQSLSEKWFAFCLVWSIGASADEMGRRKIDEVLRNIESLFPPMATVYEYSIDVKTKDFKPWEERLNSAWRPPRDIEFQKITVPTVDTLRNSFVVESLVHAGHAVLAVGDTGTGKTVLVQQMLENMPQDKYAGVVLNFSAATASVTVQDIIEGVLERRAKDKMGPPAGRKLICFVDDLNMPKKDTFGSQPPLELLRQWVDYGGWYDRDKQLWRYILDMQLVASMGPPGGGRSVISERLQSRFNLINFTFPADAQVRRIFDTILVPKLSEFEDEIKPMGAPIVAATVELYKHVLENFLPTPQKSHYLFNMRDISRVIQGMCNANKDFFDSKESILRLWVHEVMRVFGDRFTNEDDNAKFRSAIDERLQGVDSSYLKVMDGLEDAIKGPVYVDFLSEPVGDEKPPYVEATDMGALKMLVEEKLEDYNLEPSLLPMDLVLFRDALRHVCRINRVLKTPSGNALLVGVGGSGRQSLTRLAAFVAEMSTFSIKITKQYRGGEFREDLRSLFNSAGVEGKPTVFLFIDTQIKEESFLEDINNILSSGETPNLYEKDEKSALLDAMRPIAKKAGVPEMADQLWKLFIDRVKSNLHVVLAMSPIGEAFRNRVRMYPSLVNCTTIDWFHPWPADALKEVAVKFLEEAALADDTIKERIGNVFSHMQLSVVNASDKMLMELRRHNYVTPTNFLELVKGYRALLEEKRQELGDARDKLQNGLAKLDESRVQVEDMTVELNEKKEIVAQKSKDCDDLLVRIVSERRVADEQKKQVEAESARIGKEEVQCKAIADEAEADLAKALPALEKAMEEVDKLDKSSISEVKAYAKPPAAVETVLGAVMVLFGLKTDWGTAKKKISEANFLSQVKNYDKDSVHSATIHKLKKYTSKGDFNPTIVRASSNAAAALCTWVLAVEIYAAVAKEVAPKRAKLKNAMDTLAVKQAALKSAQEKLQLVIDQVEKLKEQHESSVSEKNALRDEAEMLQAKLARAEKLVSGLSGERERWEVSIGTFTTNMVNLVGDCVVAAAFLSYAGPFDSVYRTDLTKGWLAKVKEQTIPFSEGFDFATFLANPTDVRDWQIQGLPADAFSTENGVVVTRGRRWPLMVDPQGQANKWIKNMEGDELKATDQNAKDFIRELENAIKFGMPYLLQDVEEELDPALEPVLQKAVYKVGNRLLIRLGDNELDYSHDFRFYLTTKMANPHYTPEVSTKVTVVNFSVKEEGLEAQLLGIVVKSEEPKLETQKNELVVSVAAGKRKLVELEDEILRLLSTSKGSLLDDEELVNTLQVSKTTSEEVTTSLKVAEETEIKIDAAREGYRPVSARSALLYFVLNDFATVDPMYQFSLDAYITLFEMSIRNSRDRDRGGGGGGGGSDELAERIQAINTFHTYEVYKYTCRGLFERHKLLLSLQICIKKLQREGKVPPEEWSFFLRGGLVMDREEQRSNPVSDWLDPTAWDNITELDKLRAFGGIVSSFDQTPRDWKRWYMSAAPENEPLPGEWDSKCSELQAMIILRSLRPDRVLFAATKYVSNNLGPMFVDPPAFDLQAIYDSSTNTTPLIFVLSPGVDPTRQVQALAETMGVKLDSCALGQGQAPVATQMIEDGLAVGNWVFLQNCHLSISWMPALEKIVETYCTSGEAHDGFRLWLSSDPHPKFPISILQRGVKMTTEPPRGIKANMLRLYNSVTEEMFTRCTQATKYKRLLFCLCWFHAVLLERRKFKALGWNIPYDFNNADFSICEDIVALYLDGYPEKTPWDAIRYLIAEANYGGRITDDWDRRLCNVYVSQYFCEEALTVPNFPLSDLPDYTIPDDGDLKSYKDFIKGLPMTDHPAAFGQHGNADIQAAIEDTNDLLTTILSLQPRVVSSGGESNEDKVLALAADLERSVPEAFDVEEVQKVMEGRADPDPLKTVLFQEIDRYNSLLQLLSSSLSSLQKGIKGLVVITPELEQVFDALLIGKVPEGWSFCYPSLKPLGTWMRDLVDRVSQMRSWVEEAMPKVFWLSGFTYPTGFLTALLQTSARKNGVAIDTLSWDFPVLQQDEAAVTAYPKEGAYVRGMFVEGARWDTDHGCLVEPRPMELFCPMPLVHFKPVENKKKSSKGMYTCPLYMYPVRTGTRERPSFMIAVDLKSGAVDATFWTKRGTALLLQLAH